MLTVEGIYKDGKIELLETVSEVKQAKVLVTFLENSDVDLKTLNIDEVQAGELREKFAAFEDWNDPALDVYNDYDNAKSVLTNRIERGAVLLVPFPNSDLRTAKLRPALVVQADNLNTNLPQIVLIMISSNLSRANHKSRILLKTNTEQGKKSGLLFDSVVMTDNFATILTTNIARVIGKLEEMTEIDDALRHTLGL